MPQTYTTKELAEMYGISDRQCRNWLNAIKDRRVELRNNRGIWPGGITIDFDEIRDLGLSAYRRCEDLCPDTTTPDTTTDTTPETTAIATVTPDTTPDTTTAIAPIAPVEIVPCAGEGGNQAIDALAILESRLFQAEQMLAERSRELDDRARQRDRITRNLALRAAQIQAQKVAIDQREIWEQALDSEAGKFAARVLG